MEEVSAESELGFESILIANNLSHYLGLSFSINLVLQTTHCSYNKWCVLCKTPHIVRNEIDASNCLKTQRAS